MVNRATHERSEMLTNSKDVSSRTAAGIDAPRLRRGLAKRSQSASDLLVRVAGAMPGPAFGPAAPEPTTASSDLPRSFKLQEPLTRGLSSRPQLGSAQVQWLQTRFLAKKEVA
jgi:hypothetical protein